MILAFLFLSPLPLTSTYDLILPRENEWNAKLEGFLREFLLDRQNYLSIGFIDFNSGYTSDFTPQFFGVEESLPRLIIDQDFIEPENNSDVKTTFNVIFLKNLQVIDDAIDFMALNSFWNNLNNIFFISFSRNYSEDELEYFLGTVWRSKIYNFNVIFADSNGYQVFSYNAFFTPHVLNNTDVIKDEAHLFSDKLKDTNNHKFKIILFEDKPRIYFRRGKWTGRDYYLMESVMRMLRATFELIIIDSGKNFEEASKLLASDAADFCFVSYLYENKYEDVDFTYPIKEDSLVLVVAKAGSIPRFENMFMIFETPVSLTIIFLLVGLALLDTMWSKNNGSQSVFSKFIRYFLHYWCILLEWPVYNFGKRLPRSNILSITWTLSSFLLGVAFDCFLVSSLLTTKYRQNIQTIEEARNLPFTIYTYNKYSNLVSRDFQLHHKMKVVKRSELYSLASDNISEGNAYIIREDFVKALGVYNAIHGRGKNYHIVPEKLYLGYSVYMLPKYSAFKDMIYRCIRRDSEYGLSAGKMVMKRRNRDMFRTLHRRKKAVLDLDSLGSAFLVYGVGIGLSLVTFISELLF